MGWGDRVRKERDKLKKQYKKLEDDVRPHLKKAGHRLEEATKDAVDDVKTAGEEVGEEARRISEQANKKVAEVADKIATKYYAKHPKDASSAEAEVKSDSELDISKLAAKFIDDATLAKLVPFIFEVSGSTNEESAGLSKYYDTHPKQAVEFVRHMNSEHPQIFTAAMDALQNNDAETAADQTEVQEVAVGSDAEVKGGSETDTEKHDNSTEAALPNDEQSTTVIFAPITDKDEDSASPAPVDTGSASDGDQDPESAPNNEQSTTVIFAPITDKDEDSASPASVDTGSAEPEPAKATGVVVDSETP